eukprot:TRINITY_DN76444_c0_g1_i1.p1 TRINITY_DN76444_c0_g1~~TRINITY_DN76444_c0_g1_i1.p1  ORF type:complete len:186 (+),score=41.26 TRINITY_DN76444_c0_g1_i1:55-612(+)
MAQQRQRRGAVLWCFFGLLAILGCLPASFTVPHGVSSGARVARKAFETGKLNLGLDLGSSAVPDPVLVCDESTRLGIMDCLEQGCSVEALLEFDARLAKDEQKIHHALEELQQANKMQGSKQISEKVAWYNNFLSRTSTLRTQLRTVRQVKNEDFVTKFLKAAAVAFGGARPCDYPAIGVSPYTA